MTRTVLQSLCGVALVAILSFLFVIDIRIPLLAESSRESLITTFHGGSTSDVRRIRLANVEPQLETYLRATETPPFPSRAFMITTRAAQTSGRTAHAVAQVRDKLGITDIELIYGGNTSDADVGCARQRGSSLHNSCAFGVVWANQQIWRAIAAEGLASALVLEDDVLFHDDFQELLPPYWAQVPANFEFVYLGHLPHWMFGDSPKLPETAVTFGEAPYCTHAYVVTAASAGRLALLFDQFMHLRGRRREVPDAAPEFDYTDVKIDQFLPNHALRLALDRSKWVVFGSTPTLPAAWEGATFLNNRKAWEEPLRKCHCDEEVRPECRGFLPIISIGLAYQHYHCNNMTRLHLWVEQYRRDLADLRSGAIAMPASASPAYWSF
jgi:hypothetical protein